MAEKIKTNHFWADRRDPKTGIQYRPKALVLHIGGGSASGDLSWIQDPRSYVSYNWYIDEKAQRYEVVPEQHAAWANGRMDNVTQWKGIIKENNERVNPNLYTISVAVTNKGLVPPWKQWIEWVKLCNEILTRNNWEIDALHVVNHYEIRSKACPRPWFTRQYLKLLTKLTSSRIQRG